MKLSGTLFVALHLLSELVAAHPFVIVHTQVQNPVTAHFHRPRQNLLDNIQSAFDSALGIDDDTSTTLVPAATRASASALPSNSPPPELAGSTTSSSPKQSRTTQSSNKSQSTTDDSDDSTSTTTDDASTTTQSSSHTSTSPSTSALPSTSSTVTAAPAPSLGNSSPSTTSSAGASNANTPDNGSVPAGGIAVAVIMILLILAITAFLLFKYHPRCQAWWARREERARQERSYREAIDGRAESPSLRQQALAGGASKRRTMLQSFFAPATARLSNDTEIRRKPVNWGAPAVPPVPVIPKKYPVTNSDCDSEKLSMTASAAPLGQIERFSMMAAEISLPAPPPPPKSSPKSLPSTPPLPSSVHTPVPEPRSFVAELPASMPATRSSPPEVTRNLTATSIRSELPASNQTLNPTYLSRKPTTDSTRSELPSTSYQQPQATSARLPASTYQSTTTAKSVELSAANHGAPFETPAVRSQTVTCPVSPMSLRPQPSPTHTDRSFGDLSCISPMSTVTARQPRSEGGPDRMRSISSLARSESTVSAVGNRVTEEIPILPPLPTLPALVHATKGSDGVFRLVEDWEKRSRG